MNSLVLSSIKSDQRVGEVIFSFLIESTSECRLRNLLVNERLKNWRFPELSLKILAILIKSGIVNGSLLRAYATQTLTRASSSSENVHISECGREVNPALEAATRIEPFEAPVSLDRSS